MKKITLLLLLIPIIAYSQHHVKGRVLEQSNKPIDFAEIIIQTTDSVLVKFVLSDNDGYFTLSDINKGTYELIFKYFSNIFHEQTIVVEGDLDIGDIVSSAKILLEAIEIKADLSIKKEIGGKYIVSGISSSPLAENKSSFEFLGTIPILNKSEDGKSLLFKNKKNATVLINGKEVGDSEIGMSILQSLPAKDIKKVEIISNPGSDYSANNNEGIINVITKKSDEGIKGSVSLNINQSFYNSQEAKANLSFTKKSFYLTTGVRFDNTCFKNKQHSIYKDLLNKQETEIDFDYLSKSKSITSYLNMNYEINSKNNIGVQFNTSFKDLKNTNTSTSNYSLIFSQSIDSINQTIIETKSPNWKSLFFNANYSLKTDTIGSNLDINLYKYYRENPAKSFNDFYLVNNYQSILQKTDTKNDLLIFTANHQQNFRNEDVLKSGISYNKGKVENDFFYGKFIGIDYVSDTSRSNFFTYQDNTFAAYIIYQKVLGDSWEAELGARWESYYGEGKSEVSSKTNQINNYLFPSLSVIFYANDDNEFSLDYRSGIRRPSYNYYNPNIYYTSYNSYKRSNPNLVPILSHSVNLNYSFYENYSFDIEYGYGKNIFNDFDIVLKNGLIETVTDNYGKAHDIWIDFSYDNQFFDGRWNFSSSIYYNYVNSIGEYNQVDLGYINHSWGIDIKNYVFLNKKKNTCFSVKYGYGSADESILGEMNAYHSLIVDFNASFKNFNFSIGAFDLLLNDVTFKKETLEYEFTKINYYYKTVYFSVSYYFGNKKVKILNSKEYNTQERFE